MLGEEFIASPSCSPYLIIVLLSYFLVQGAENILFVLHIM